MVTALSTLRLYIARNEALMVLDGLLPRRLMAALQVRHVRCDGRGRVVVSIGTAAGGRGARASRSVALPPGDGAECVLSLRDALAAAGPNEPLFGGISEEAIRHRIKRMRR